jgi:hypothetical protein
MSFRIPINRPHTLICIKHGNYYDCFDEDLKRAEPIFRESLEQIWT